MTETLTRASARTTRQDLRRYVLALVLYAVLVWYTVISPSYTAAPLARATGGETPDAEERGLDARAAPRPAASGAARSAATRADAPEHGEDVDELDWPEIIDDERGVNRES